MIYWSWVLYTETDQSTIPSNSEVSKGFTFQPAPDVKLCKASVTVMTACAQATYSHTLPPDSLVCCSDVPLTENFHSPPTSSPFSKQVGSSPSSRQFLMEARPLMPAPMMATFFTMVACAKAQRFTTKTHMHTLIPTNCYAYMKEETNICV